jgi:hypothetical protein
MGGNDANEGKSLLLAVIFKGMFRTSWDMSPGSRGERPHLAIHHDLPLSCNSQHKMIPFVAVRGDAAPRRKHEMAHGVLLPEPFGAENDPLGDIRCQGGSVVYRKVLNTPGDGLFFSILHDRTLLLWCLYESSIYEKAGSLQRSRFQIKGELEEA